MRVTVHLFGPAALAAGAAQVEVQADGDAPTCAVLRTALAAAHPGLSRFLPSCRFAVNHEFAAEERVLHSSDEVALIGMVSGG